MLQRQVHHAAFTVERNFRSPRAKVFGAFVDPEARRRWLVESDGWTVHDFRPPVAIEPGAVECSCFSPPGSEAVLTNDTTYLTVEDERRLIFAYSMSADGEPLSASLSTVEFLEDGSGTRLVLTEQGAYFDENVKGREEGTRQILHSLARELAEA